MEVQNISTNFVSNEHIVNVKVFNEMVTAPLFLQDRVMVLLVQDDFILHDQRERAEVELNLCKIMVHYAVH